MGEGIALVLKSKADADVVPLYNPDTWWDLLRTNAAFSELIDKLDPMGLDAKAWSVWQLPGSMVSSISATPRLTPGSPLLPGSTSRTKLATPRKRPRR